MSELQRVIVLERQVDSMVNATVQLQDITRDDLSPRLEKVERAQAEHDAELREVQQALATAHIPTLIAAVAQLQSKYRELLAEVEALRGKG